MSATRPKDLRTGHSLWLSRPLSRLPQKVLRRDLATDVLVVGAGISGALIADQLTDAGLDVVIVDRRGPLMGSTPASTALLQYEIDVPLTKLAVRIGRTRAERVWRRSRLALEALRERSRHLGVDADQTNCDSLYLEGNELDADGLRAEAAARREAGLETTFLGARAVQTRFGIRRRSALLGYGNLSADPRRLAAGFLRAALSRGARLYAPANVVAVYPGHAGVRAEFESGRTVRASSVVFATGYELPKGVPRRHHTIASTWALSTRPQPRRLWDGCCLIWEAARPYLYLRAGPHGEVICGGEDEEFSDEAKRDRLSAAKFAAIEEKLVRLLPSIDPRPLYTWCGTFGGSDTGTPSIGPVPRMPNCYAVLGYGGNGITFSMMAAQMLRTMIEGGNDQDSDLFSFSRRV